MQGRAAAQDNRGGILGPPNKAAARGRERALNRQRRVQMDVTHENLKRRWNAAGERFRYFDTMSLSHFLGVGEHGFF